MLRTVLIASALLSPSASLALPDPMPELKLTLPGAEAPPPDDLNFDLLGQPPKAQPTLQDQTHPAAQPDEARVRTRRTMLTVHQSLGVGLLTCTLASVVLGQLNYSDRFAGPSTGRYELSHAAVSFTTFGVFAGTGLVALLAPSPLEKKSQGFDRATLHKVAMFTAAAGMATQAGLGIGTVSREGYQNQKTLAQAHLAVGYFTLAAMLVGVGAMVF